VGLIVGKNQIPLFLTNRPVVLPLPGFRGPVFTSFDARPEPPDPLDYKLDPLRPISDKDVELLFSHFPAAAEIMVFFCSHILLCFTDQESLSEAILPRLYGGLTITRTLHRSRLSSGLSSQLPDISMESMPTNSRRSLLAGDELVIHGRSLVRSHPRMMISYPNYCHRS
jgi:hypothetical protein